MTNGILVGALLALAVSTLPLACQSSGGGSDCFPPEHGPADPSCAGFAVGLTCPVGATPWYTCVCTMGNGTGGGGQAGQTWVCGSVDMPPSGAGGGSSASGAGGSSSSTSSSSSAAATSSSSG